MSILVSVLTLLIDGCGAGSTATSSSETTQPSTATVAGIATPTILSVITAK